MHEQSEKPALCLSFGSTDPGKVRDHNEDNFAKLPSIGLWLVADGMGGYEGGEIASNYAVKSIVQAIKGGKNLSTAILEAHQIIMKVAKQGKGKIGMGSTVVALKVDQSAENFEFEIAWVGDSRAYLWHPQKNLIRLTRDHSIVQDLLDSEVIDENEAREHPRRNAITQALGIEDMMGNEIDSVHGQFCRNEKILLCSDGLTGELTDDEINNIISAGSDEKTLIKTLIESALQQGGEDNVTAILVSAPKNAKPRKSDIFLERAGKTQEVIKISSSNNRTYLIPLILTLTTSLILGWVTAWLLSKFL